MTNIIIPVLSEDMFNFAKNLEIKDCLVIIGTTKDFEAGFEKKQNQTIKLFEKGSKKEEIINALKRYLEKGKILICRKPLTAGELEQFIKPDKDITLCKAKERNKVSKFFAGIWNNFMQFLFGFSFFDGDPSAICFNEKLYDVIINLSSLSYVSRLNRWKGVSFGYVNTSGEKPAQEYNKVASNFMLCGWILLFLATIASTALYIYFVGPAFLPAFLWTCAILISEVGMLIAIAIYAMNIKVGSRKFGEAKLIREEL